MLYNPIVGRREWGNWNDHGETIKPTQEGLDFAITATVPAGMHRLSLCFCNAEGHDGAPACRDYLLELTPYPESEANVTPFKFMALPVLARARVRDFWGPVYKQFIVAGPGAFCIKIKRGNSYNTVLQAVMLDQLSAPKPESDLYPLPWLELRYSSPDPDPPVPLDPHLLEKVLGKLPLGPPPESPAEKQRHGAIQAARELWSALDKAYPQEPASALQWSYHKAAYQAALAAGAPPVLLANWRWQLRLWSNEDRKEFEEVMAQSPTIRNK